MADRDCLNEDIKQFLALALASTFTWCVASQNVDFVKWSLSSIGRCQQSHWSGSKFSSDGSLSLLKRIKKVN